ncbi:MAG TPA: HEAT repeat domain-containing protein [Terriglobales bacterium]
MSRQLALISCALLSLTAFSSGQRDPILTGARTMLVEAAADKNPDTRVRAAEAMSLLPSQDELLDAQGPLAALLADHDVSVRIAATSALADSAGRTPSRAVLDRLEAMLNDPVPEVDYTAARSLDALHDQVGTDFLMAVVSGDSKSTSSFLATHKRSALRLLQTPGKLFTTALVSSAEILSPLPVGLGVSSLRGILGDNVSPRAATLLLLNQSRDPALPEVVEKALTDKDASVRAAAVHVVATHPLPGLAAGLAPLLDDKSASVRLRAAAALLRLH